MKMRGLYTIKICILICVLVFVLSPCTAFAAKKLVLADVSWDSVQVHNRIAGFILEHGYGYDVEYVPGDTIALFAGMARGDIDITMELWVENLGDLLVKAVKEGSVLDLGSNFPDSRQGWLVPTYVIKGDPARGIKPLAPGLKSVSDLPKYWKVFKDVEDPGKGRFYTCLPGWNCLEINEVKMTTYGLNKYYNIFVPGSDAALVGSMASAYKKGKPWFGYYWAPTWALGKYDMTFLEEPAYNKAAWDKNYGCAYPPVRVNIGVNAKMQEKAPEVVAFLSKYDTTQAICNKFLAYMQDNKADTAEAALWFLKNYLDLWTPWVPADVAQKVKAAME